MLALGLASCAVLPPQGVAGQDEAQAAARAEAGIAAVLSQAECRRLAGQRARLQAALDQALGVVTAEVAARDAAEGRTGRAIGEAVAAARTQALQRWLDQTSG
ncbi:hypothetical protein [Acidovorax cavernicola]|uniref:hypothetical protein n=1 Tax=Acidovorax cavernicola TaxID=1675792 RepID=UPI0011C441C6|nr:hypothetical protein [Acidovorax cavernicola]